MAKKAKKAAKKKTAGKKPAARKAVKKTRKAVARKGARKAAPNKMKAAAKKKAAPKKKATPKKKAAPKKEGRPEAAGRAARSGAGALRLDAARAGRRAARTGDALTHYLAVPFTCTIGKSPALLAGITSRPARRSRGTDGRAGRDRSPVSLRPAALRPDRRCAARRVGHPAGHQHHEHEEPDRPNERQRIGGRHAEQQVSCIRRPTATTPASPMCEPDGRQRHAAGERPAARFRRGAAPSATRTPISRWRLATE